MKIKLGKEPYPHKVGEGRGRAHLCRKLADLYLNVGDLWAPLSSVLPHSLG